MLVVATIALAGGALPAPSDTTAEETPSAAIRHEKGSGLEVRFVAYPWRPDVFQALEEGSPTAHGWAFARLVVSSYFDLEGTRLFPGHYAMVLNPKTGALPMALELRRVANREFLVDAPAMALPPPGETVYKKPVTFTPGSEPVPALDLTIATWNEGSSLTIRYGNRKLAKDLSRATP